VTSPLTCTIEPGGYPDMRTVRVMHGDRLAGVLLLPETEAVNAVELLHQRMLQDRARQIGALRCAAEAIDVALISHEHPPSTRALLEQARDRAREAADVSESHITPARRA